MISRHDIIFPAMTLGDVARTVFEQDWNTRRDVLAASSDDTVTLMLTLRYTVPAVVAQEVLADLNKKAA
jgi:hypothetical protein